MRVSVSPSRWTVCLALLVGLAGCARTPASPPPIQPQVNGTVEIDGLGAPVRVVRDTWGVPHIYASSQNDLFIAQGFVQAEERLFQMDLWRRAAEGQLAEVLGANFSGRDAMTRRIQYGGGIDEDWAAVGPDVKPIADAFVRGINAWVALARERPPEEFVLAGWRPDFWDAEDLLTRTDAFVASDAALDEIFRARLVAAAGPPRAAALLGTQAIVVPREIDLSPINFALADAIRQIGTRPFFTSLSAPVPAASSAASNAWVIAPNGSATGKPLVANDPHQPFESPSPYYLVHLHAPGWNVAGATPPWLPGVALGHNEQIAWGMAAHPADAQDIYVERLNPANRHEVEDEGRWVPTRVVRSRLGVKSRSVSFEREYTRHGLIVAIDPDRHLAFTLRWNGAEPGAAAGLAATIVDRAASWPAFRGALARWKAPVVEAVYGDVEGNIGTQVAGLLPVRRDWDGAVPAPGWTSGFEWTRWRTVDELPYAFNPATGLAIATNANRARMNRLSEMLRRAELGVDDFERVQRDALAWNATVLVPLLARVRAPRPDLDEVRQRLLGWNKQLLAGSQEAVIYVAWERALRRLLLRPRVDQTLADEFEIRAAAALVPALTTPSAVWFGPGSKDASRARDKMLIDALEAAVEDLKKETGALANPSWGQLHRVTFEHPLAVNEVAGQRFNAGPFPASGYEDTVLSTGGPGLQAARGPSFRAVYDLSDWDQSMVTNAPGQSGSPSSPHFRDLAEPWSRGQYFPLLFSDAAVTKAATSTLTLVPKAK